MSCVILEWQQGKAIGVVKVALLARESEKKERPQSQQ
jgi:hypothetical protein